MTSAIVQGTLVGPIVTHLGEARTALLGLSLTALSFTLYAVATQGVIGAFGSLATPAVQGAISRQVPAEEQGLLQGALAGIANLTNVISPPLVAGLFAYFVSATAPFKFLGAALFLCTFFALAALLVARRAFKQLPNDTMFRADSSSFAQD